MDAPGLIAPLVAHSEPVAYLECQEDDTTCATKPMVIESAWPLIVNGQHWLTVLCTPTKLDYFVLGFLYNEGLIASPDEVLDLQIGRPTPPQYSPGGEAVLEGDPVPGGGRALSGTPYRQDGAVIRVELQNRDLRLPQRRTLTSGCGGGITFVDLAAARDPIQSALQVTAEQISGLMTRLMATVADDYRRVGGFHTAGLGDGHQLLAVATDIGRHNTLDKVAGECLARNISMRESILLTSGRVSVEMLGKAARMQVPIVATLNSPTHLAVELARNWRISLIGYARGTKMHVYTGWGRICAEPQITHVRRQQKENV